MISIKERLAAAKLPERSVQVCLRGDLAAEFDMLEAKLKDARASEGSRRLASKGDAVQIAEQIRDLAERMSEAMLTVRVRALPRAEWNRIMLQHPPGKDASEGDKAMGVSFEAFMADVMPRCIVDPELDEDDWATLNNVLSSADYGKILDAVWAVNRSEVDVPKSRLASLVMAESAAASRQQPGSE